MEIDNFLRELHKNSSFIPKPVINVLEEAQITPTTRKRTERICERYFGDDADDVSNLDQDEDIQLIAELLGEHNSNSSDVILEESSSPQNCNPNPAKRPRRELNFDEDLFAADLYDYENENTDRHSQNSSRRSESTVQNGNIQTSRSTTKTAAGTPGTSSGFTASASNARQHEEEEPEIVVRYRKVLKLMPTVPFVPITCTNGSRVYLRLLPDPDNNIVINKNQFSMLVQEEQPKPVRRGLLGRTFEELKKEALASKNNFNTMLGELALDSVEQLTVDGDTKEKEVSLWVDKYKPKSYMDLLSEETINHTILHWLKIWDKSVFGTDYLSKVRETRERYSKLMAKDKENAEKWKKIVVDESYDELGRPKQKVVLLYGPPGLGKTTAAHIICKHAGYNVIELNASDDRSVDIFKKTLDATTQSRSEMFQDGRPNCLVIDEIDGAPLPTVTVLVDLITGKSTESGKNKAKKVLRRPIICICNELYTPSLKNLRKLALLVPFQPISVASLVERLEDISIKENLSLDNTTMYSMAEKTDCDVRSCLACMQFMKGKTMGPKARDKMLDQLGIQNKNKGIFEIWKDVFQIPEGKKKSYYGQNNVDPTKAGARFNNILSEVQSYGEYPKLLDGVFENYLRTNFRDTYFQSILQGLDWIHWFEQIQNYINHQQNYALYPLLPFCFVASHFLFAGRNWVKLQYPTNETFQKSSRLMNTTKSQIVEMNPNIGRFVNVSSLTLDIFPSLIAIIQPSSIRPVPTQLWSPKERELVKIIVDIMIAYNITYTQQRSVDGGYSFLMEPDIEELANFPSGASSINKKQFSYAVKQLIAREIETEKLRRGDDNNGTYNMDMDTYKKMSQTPTPKKLFESMKVAQPPPPSASMDIESQDMAIVKEVKAKPFCLSDYFNVKIIPKKVKVVEGAIEEPEKVKAQPSDIYYRFKSGFTNAVRRNLKLKDFL